MKTDTLQFSYGTQIASFYGPTKIVKAKTEMLCRRGWYNVKTEQGMLIGNAEVYDGDKIIKGDTLEYDPITKLFKSRGDSYYEDRSQNLILRGDKIVNDEKNKTVIVSGNACISKQENSDRIQISADTLVSISDSLNKQFTKAYRNVRIFNPQVQALSDSITFSEQMDVLQLFNNPIVWSDNAELKGQKMNLYLKDSVVDKIEIFENSSVIMELDSGNYYNQLSGKNMIAYFTDQKLKSANVNGNAWTIFYPQEEKTTDSVFVIKRKGMNRLFAGDLRLDLDSGEVKGVSYIDKPDGKFYPMNKINKEDQFIKGFSWSPFLRPKNGVCYE
jgi:lipopolysaccharide export system protein LptA